MRVYTIDKYKLDESGEIECYEDLFFTGSRPVAIKKFKEFAASDPEDVYTLDVIWMSVPNVKDKRSMFEIMLQNNGGKYDSCIH